MSEVKEGDFVSSCYWRPHFEDLRYYWCHKLKKEISGIAIRIPDKCPLKTMQKTIPSYKKTGKRFES